MSVTAEKFRIYIALLTAFVAAYLFTATPALAGSPQPGRIAAISRSVFGSRWRVAACIAHYESTDGAYLYNGVNLGPWQVSVSAHPWVSRRVVWDWRYAARVAYRISRGGRDWRSWTTRAMCGV